MAHYVDNKKFLEAIVEYRSKVTEAKLKDKPKPIVSNYIGECILKIATHLSYKPNFINYSYREEMISDGIENCLQYIDNFDPSKSNNPFAYFTQIIYYAFLRRIQKEKKQTYIKGKMIQELPMELFDVQDGEESNLFHNTYMEHMQSNHQVDDFFERKREQRAAAKKAKSSHVSLEDFIDTDDDPLDDMENLDDSEN
jgi:hypothetical protein